MKIVMTLSSRRRVLARLAVFALPLFLTACGGISHIQRTADEFPTVMGPSVTNNKTPVDDTISCMSEMVRKKNVRRVSVSVGEIGDYTGKYSEQNGGKPITQGGALMAISALGKFGNVIIIRERLDPRVSKLEYNYLQERRLGDGNARTIREKGVDKTVRWLPDQAGTILPSEVFIVGGITELNWNVHSSGAGFIIEGIGPRARTFVVSIALDLRLVNTKNLNVLKTVSLQKQVVGYEVEAEIFRFLPTLLVDAEAGIKSQEPLQLAVRSAIEMGIVDLIGHIFSVDADQCYTHYKANGIKVEESPSKHNIVASKPEPAPKALNANLEDAMFVQAGAFSKKDNAERARRLLRDIGTTKIELFKHGDDTLYRVQLGPFAKRDKAAAALKRTHEVGFQDARLIAPG